MCSQHDGLAARHQAQRLEAARALGVVLEQEFIHIEHAEKFLGNDVVTALGVPAATAIAAADVDSEGDAVARNAFQAEVIAEDGIVELRVRIEAHHLTHFASGHAVAISDNVGSHGGPALAVMLIDVLDDALAFVAAGQIQIDIGPLAALLGEKTFKQ